MRNLIALLAANRYGELEKAIQRESDPAKRAQLERDLLHAARYGYSYVRTEGI